METTKKITSQCICQPKIHLVFCDVVLPDRDGPELVDQLLSRKPKLCILLTSGYTDQKSQWSVIRERGFRFLQKPYPIPNLLRAIRRAIEPSKRNQKAGTASSIP